MIAVFGIRLLVDVDEYQYGVGQDSTLWEWLLADNAVAAERKGKLVVPAPVGYVFNRNAVVKNSPAFDGLLNEFPGDGPLSRNGYVNVGKVRSDKALMLLRAESDTLTWVTEEEFHALKIDEARIMDTSFPTY